MNAIKEILKTFPDTSSMPVLFLGHGSPMNAIEENEFVAGFREVAKSLPKPKAILCISAHWLTRGTKVTSMEYPRTIHDFGGFPPELYQVQYPAKGSPELARSAQQLLESYSVESDDVWGLDHGAWSVIKHLYPQADVPVVQLSIDYYKPAKYHFELAAELQRLRKKGVLIIGSGNIVHNLQLIDFKNINKVDYGYDWALEARNLVNQKLFDGKFQDLIKFESMGKSLQLAIPTPDHYLPLLYVIALKQNSDPLSVFNDKMIAGSLSMSSVKIG